MDINVLETLFNTYKETKLFGRYITLNHITPLLNKLKNSCDITVIGHSVNQQPISVVKIGSGSKKILMWSQMHGNESTTTKAVFDLLNTFLESNSITETILKQCTIAIIPMLNPDGAKAYTRINANQVDLNRDAQNLTQPESNVLRNYYEQFLPDFCFNLHGQRTIFSAGSNPCTATVSFLAPAQDKQCTITNTRKVAMAIIAKMNAMLQRVIPNQIGRYDDAYNINCVGDTFQSFNVPTILFEAGHAEDDYEREVVRKLIYKAYLEALHYISGAEIDLNAYESYLNIPENKKMFYDIIIRNALVNNLKCDVCIQFAEILDGKTVKFRPKVVNFSNPMEFYGHKSLNANGYEVFTVLNQPIALGNEIDFVSINSDKIPLF